MNELRWILLAAGVVLLVAVYAWGVRSRKRSATPDFERARRVEPPPQAPAAPPVPAEPQRREPRITLDDVSPMRTETDTPAAELDFRVGAESSEDAPAAPVTPSPARAEAVRAEPTLSSTMDIPVGHEPPGPRIAATGASAASKPAQKIVAVRVTAPLPTRFEGAQLRESIRSNGLQHGRFDIFHRLAPDGRPIISLASLLEPGTFDPAAMDGVSYPGVALFTVLPGPVSAIEALEDLLVTSRALAIQLKGTVLDDRGAPLSLQRIAHMRDEVLAFERGVRTPETAG